MSLLLRNVRTLTPRPTARRCPAPAPLSLPPLLSPPDASWQLDRDWDRDQTAERERPGGRAGGQGPRRRWTMWPLYLLVATVGECSGPGAGIWTGGLSNLPLPPSLAPAPLQSLQRVRAWEAPGPGRAVDAGVLCWAWGHYWVGVTSDSSSSPTPPSSAQVCIRCTKCVCVSV